MPDFAASDTNRSTSYGRTGNAYDVRFSPGGSSGGTVTAVTSNEAEMGTGTDTANSIRMPSSTSSVVGVLPTRGLVSIAGIAPLDWLRDNTGPIARNVTDAAIALGVMVGADPLDFRTKDEPENVQPGPYTQYLKADAMKGKRFGVPAFIVSPESAAAGPGGGGRGLKPETRAAFMKAIEGLRAAGATVVIDASILPDGFSADGRVNTNPYRKQGMDSFLAEFGPSQYHSAEEYAKAVGSPLPGTVIGGQGFGAADAAPAAGAGGGRGGRGGAGARAGAGAGGGGLANAAPATPTNPTNPRPPIAQATLESDPNANANYFGPQEKMLATYNEALDRLHLDGLVYPAANMPPPDETMLQNGGLSGGPHSNTGWVNNIGVPAIVLPGGFYDDGLPFGLEISARRWKDGDLLGWAYAYEQATHLRHPPVLVDKGLLPNTPPHN
jgi:Asp-tRNA(Asn)/Glu-tRNA(Gln) amidotransferase A subunit family amidase